MRRRLFVVPIVRDAAGAYLLCRTPARRGARAARWCLPGSGVEAGEKLEDALAREAREELGLRLARARPLFFSDGVRERTRPDGRRQLLYVIFLVFECRVAGSFAAPPVCLNDEFAEYAWVDRAALSGYDLDESTTETLRRAGILKGK